MRNKWKKRSGEGYIDLRPHPLRHAGDRIGGEGAAGVCGEAAA